MDLLVKPLAGLLGFALTMAGIAGFFVGTGMLFGFDVDAMHSTIHLVTGVIGLLAYGTSQIASRWYLMVFGILYTVIAIIGFALGDNIIGLFMVNTADNWLHLGIGTTCLIVSLGSGK